MGRSGGYKPVRDPLSLERSPAKLFLVKLATKVFPNWAEPYRRLSAYHRARDRIVESVPYLKQICRLAPGDHQALVDLVHALHQARRDQEIESVVAIPPFRIVTFWRLAGKLVRARFHPDGSVRNMDFLAIVFRPIIRRGLAAMDRARLCAELYIGIVGDEQGFVRLLEGRLAIQRELIKCLGLDSSPLRYMANYWVRKIGHLGQIEFYFKSLLLGLVRPHRPVILCNDMTEVANHCLLEYWRPFIGVTIDHTIAKERALEVQLLNLDIHLFESGSGYIYHKKAAALAYRRWQQEGHAPLFSLRTDHRERGWRALEEAGIPKGSWFVAIHVRELEFLAQRDAPIDSYLLAMREIIDRGGWVIRLGDTKMTRLPKMPGLLDYCHTCLKSDWMDIFLMAECRFFIGVASGPAQVPPLFGVPCVYTNWTPLGDYPFHGNGLLIHKRHFEKATGKRALYSRFAKHSSDYGDNAERLGLFLEDNTPEEVREVVVEMLDRLDGASLDCSEDAERQALFCDLAGFETMVGRPKLGRKFLEKNADLLR